MMRWVSPGGTIDKRAKHGMRLTEHVWFPVSGCETMSSVGYETPASAGPPNAAKLEGPQ